MMKFRQKLFFAFIISSVMGLNIKLIRLKQNVTESEHRKGRQDSISLGPCTIVLNRYCPHPDIKYFLYTHRHPYVPEEIKIEGDGFASNISESAFNPSLPTKIIIHGYNSDMFLNGLIEIKNQYLMRGNLNIFSIDWSSLAQGPCYPAAVWNSRYVGKCSALLVRRLREMNIRDLHLIGFSLGAHITGFVANHIAPYKIPRITGLDPAMPGFTTLNRQDKLDPSDAEFVDVIHTNAFIQGQVEECGHVDFYMNGGVIQPGCWADERFFACNHHRAPFYFAESISSRKGFWGWPCSNYFAYLLGRCPPKEPQSVMGEYVDKSLRGMHLVITDSVSPFSVGKFTGPTIEILRNRYEVTRISDFERYKQEMEDCSDDTFENCKNVNVFNDDVFDTVFV